MEASGYIFGAVTYYLFMYVYLWGKCISSHQIGLPLPPDSHLPNQDLHIRTPPATQGTRQYPGKSRIISFGTHEVGSWDANGLLRRSNSAHTCPDMVTVTSDYIVQNRLIKDTEKYAPIWRLVLATLMHPRGRG